MTIADSAPDPRVFWITGLSGAGKTTVARALRDRLAQSRPVVLLDGDEMREILGKTASFAREDRLELAYIYARLAKHLREQGVTVVCATISMFHDVRAWSRANTVGYFEVYLKVPESHRVARDAKGHYKNHAARQPNGGGLVGFDEPFEEPRSADVVIANNGEISPTEAVNEIWRASMQI